MYLFYIPYKVYIYIVFVLKCIVKNACTLARELKLDNHTPAAQRVKKGETIESELLMTTGLKLKNTGFNPGTNIYRREQLRPPGYLSCFPSRCSAD